MLDKSSDQILDNNLIQILKEFEQKTPSIVLCSEPFHKAEFLNKLIRTVKNPIIFVDMDLLYTGYVESGMIEKKNNVIIFHPNDKNWNERLSEIITKVSNEKFLVVIDSINGAYNMFDSRDSARFINSCIMLISSIARQSSSSIVITGIARRKETSEWVLSPGGKQIMKLGNNTEVFFLEKIENSLVLRVLQEKDTEPKTFRIEQAKD